MLVWVKPMGKTQLVRLTWVSRPFINFRIFMGQIVMVVSLWTSDRMMARS